jgi:hypothetical protein
MSSDYGYPRVDPNPADSAELTSLRQRYSVHRPFGATARATAYRLGRLAGMLGIPIDDFGAHSERWIGLFKTGFHDELRLQKTIQSIAAP